MQSASDEQRYERLELRGWSVVDIARALWRQRLLVVTITGVIVALAIVAMRFVTPVYTVSMIVAPKTTSLAASNESGLAARLLGATAGSKSSPFEVYSELITSHVVAQQLIVQYGMHRRIWAANWDEAHSRWTPPRGAVASVAGIAKKVIGWPEWSPPTNGDVADYLSRNVLQTPTQSGLFGVSSIQRVTIRTPDPKLGVDILKAIHAEADRILRLKRQRELDIAVRYLEQRLRSTELTATQQALSDLLASLMRERILLVGEEAYAATIVDPPIVPRRPSFPQPSLMIAASFVIGAILAGVVALLVDRRSSVSAREDA